MTGFDPSTLQQSPQSQPGAPPTDTATRLQEKQWLQWRYEEAMSGATAQMKEFLAQRIMAGQQELQEDTFPADPASQAEWMASTRIGMADKTLSPQRIDRRIMGAPEEAQVELASALQAQKSIEGIRQLGAVYGKQRGALAASSMGSFGRGFLDAVTFAKDDSRVLYDLAKRFAETGEVPRAEGGPESESWLKDHLRKVFGGEDLMKVIRPPEDVLPRERQAEEFLEGAKRGYEEESGKGYKALGVDVASTLQKAGGLGGIIAGPGGMMLKAGRAAGVKAASAVLGKSIGTRTAVALGWAGATAAGGAFESLHPLDGDDQAAVDKIRKEKGDKAADEAEGSLQSIRFLKGMATWGTIEALGIPLGKVGTAGGMRVPGLLAGAKRAAAGAASGAALEPASALGDLPPFQEMYRQVTGKDPKLKTAVARAYKVQVDPKATTGEKVEAWKQAAGHMAIDAVMLGALHMASAADSVLPPSQKAQAQEVRSILAKEARAELDTKTDLPREEINRLVPSPEERPVEVPLAGRPQTFQEAQAARRRETPSWMEQFQGEFRRGMEPEEARMPQMGAAQAPPTREASPEGKVGEKVTEIPEGEPQRMAEPLKGEEHKKAEEATGELIAKTKKDYEQRVAAQRRGDAQRRAMEAAEARKAEPEAAEPARREAIAEERRFIAEKRQQAEEEGNKEAARDLEEYSRAFEDESRGEGYVPSPQKRPASTSELGKTPKDPALFVRRELSVARAEKTIAQKLKKQYGMQANEARKLIEKERGEMVLRETTEREFTEAEGLKPAEAEKMKSALEVGTRFRLRDLFEGRELTVRENQPGGVMVVSDGDRRITLVGHELTRIDPKSIVRPDARQPSLPAEPAPTVKAPEPTASVRPEALEVPWTVKKGGKPVPVRVRHEEGKVYADVILGKGDRHRFKGDSLADVEAQIQRLAKERGLEVTAATEVGTKASEAARAQEAIAQHEAAKVEGERAKAQEAREKAGQEATPEGVDAVEAALKRLQATPTPAEEQIIQRGLAEAIKGTEADIQRVKAGDPQWVGPFGRYKTKKAGLEDLKAQLERFRNPDEKMKRHMLGLGQRFAKPSDPEAGVANVAALLGLDRGTRDPMKTETAAELRALYGGTRNMVTARTGLDRTIGGFFSRAATFGHRIYNVAHEWVAKVRAWDKMVVRELVPALRQFPRDKEGKVLAFRYFNEHSPEAIQAMRDWAQAKGKDWNKVETALEKLRSMHQVFRDLMNKEDPHYKNAVRNLAETVRELQDPNLKPRDRKILEQQRLDLDEEVRSLASRGIDEYIKHVFENLSSYGGHKIEVPINQVPTRRIHGSMFRRKGREGYVEDVFVSVDRYFLGMIRAIHGTNAALKLDVLLNGEHRSIGKAVEKPDGTTFDPLDAVKPGSQFFYRRSIGADPDAKAGMKTERNLVEVVRWDKEDRVMTVKRRDSGREFQLTEDQARRLYRKKGGLLDIAARSQTEKWRGKELEEWFHNHIMGRWVERGIAEKLVGKVSRFATSWLAHTQLGILAGNIVTPAKTWALGHLFGASKRGLLPYIEATVRYMRDPALKKLVQESGALEVDRIPGDVLSEARVFPSLLQQAKEKLGVANMSAMRLTDKHNRATAAANGILELQAYSRRILKREPTKEEMYAVARQWADEAQLATDAALAGSYWSGPMGLITRPLFQFSRPQFRVFETMVSDLKRGDVNALARGVVYASIADMLYQATTSMILGNSYTLFGDYGLRVEDTGAAGDYLKKKLGKWVGSVMLIPGFPLKSIMEGKPPGIQWLGALSGIFSHDRPELAAEQAASLTFGPGLRKGRQALSARPVRLPGHEDEVEIPHPATVGEAMNPLNLRFTGQAGQRMPKSEPAQRLFTPGVSTRSEESFDLKQRLKGLAEDVGSLDIKRNTAFDNMRRAMREGREKDAEVFKAEYLQLKSRTGRASDIPMAMERERWEKLPPEVRQLAHVSKEARLQMAAEILESGPYSDATKRDVIRAVERGEEPYAGTRAETRAKYRAAKLRLLSKAEAR